MNGFDLSTISSVYVGSTQYSSIYKGSTQIWPTGSQQTEINLPTGYTRIEYIENINDSRIETPITLMSDDELYFTLENSSSIVDDSCFFCSRTTWATNDASYFPNKNGNGKVQVCFGTLYDWENIPCPSGRTDIYMSNTCITIGSQSITGNGGTFTTPGTLWLFIGHVGLTGLPYIGKLYSFKVVRNQVDILNLIPCKDSNSIVGMYDMVSNTFYSSPSGTTSFVAGPDKLLTGSTLGNDGTGDFVLGPDKQ